jgi:hypothetical protein
MNADARQRGARLYLRGGSLHKNQNQPRFEPVGGVGIARGNIVGLPGMQQATVKYGPGEPGLGSQAGQYGGCLGAVAFQHTPQARGDLIDQLPSGCAHDLMPV